MLRSTYSDEDMAFISDFPRCKYGAYLDSPDDPRLKGLNEFKNRVKKMLHQAMQRLIRVDDKSDDAIDSIKMAISASKHTLLSHPMDRTAYASVKSVRFISPLMERKLKKISTERISPLSETSRNTQPTRRNTLV